jgi:hypothetical protein
MRYCGGQAHPALFMQMRLGKTLVTTRMIERYCPRDPKAGLRALIVAPNSALGSWDKELTLDGWGEGICHLQGTRAKRVDLLAQRHPWKLINKEGHLALPELTRVPWDAVVIDESTCIKNPKAKITKFFLNHFRDVPHRWALTGTPNPQSDLEFWPQLAWLDGRAFGCRTYWEFRTRFFAQDPWGYEWSPNVGTPTMIKREVARRAFVLSRAEAGLDVPKVYETRTLTLPRKLRKTYDELEDTLILEYEGEEVGRTEYEPVKLQWLRQMCGGFIDKELVWRAKLDELVDLLTGELANDQIVVWFNYNHEGRYAEKLLRRHGIDAVWVEGKTKDRPGKLTAFQNGTVRVILLQVKIAEMGCDLSAADTAIYFSPPFGVLARSQSEDRILEVYKKGPLLIIDLLVEDSVDTALHESLTAKVAGSKWTLRRVMEIMKRQQVARKAA